MIRSVPVDDVLGPRLRLSKTVQNAVTAGSDIKRKGGRAKKNKRLIMLPGIVGLPASADASDLGVLEGIDGPAPTLTVTFPCGGRLRFQGRSVHPQQRFLHLAFEKKGEASCRDLFDSIIVFDACSWLGTEKENPDAKVLPLPDSIKSAVTLAGEDEEPRTFHFGCSERAEPRKATSTPAAASARRHCPQIVDSDDDDDGHMSEQLESDGGGHGSEGGGDDDDNAGEGLSQGLSQGERRQSGRKRKAVDYGGLEDDGNYAVPSASDSSGEEDDLIDYGGARRSGNDDEGGHGGLSDTSGLSNEDSDSDGKPRGRTSAKKAAPKSAGKATPKAKPKATPKARAPPKAKAMLKSTPKAKPKPKAKKVDSDDDDDDDDDDDEVLDLASDSDDGSDGGYSDGGKKPSATAKKGKAPAKPRAKPAAKPKAATHKPPPKAKATPKSTPKAKPKPKPKKADSDDEVVDLASDSDDGLGDSDGPSQSQGLSQSSRARRASSTKVKYVESDDGSEFSE